MDYVVAFFLHFVESAHKKPRGNAEKFGQVDVFQTGWFNHQPEFVIIL